jgi:nicotinamide-nucleotide amidase
MDNEKDRKIRNAEIICVGTELLMGHTLNTNAGYLALQLAELGIPSYRQTVIGDNVDRLLEQIKESAARSDLVILTGGLGPTVDDLTMETAAKAAGLPLVFHEPSYQALSGYFTCLGRKMSDNNNKQAFLPSPSTVFPNTNGTAPGAMFDCPAPTDSEPNHVASLLLLPGPPSEVVPMFTLSARPILEKLAPFRFKTAYVHLIGIGESSAETKVQDLIDAQDNPTIAPYASEGECMFRVTQRMDSDSDPDLLTPMLDELKNRLGEYIYEIGTRSMKEVVYDLLLSQGKTVSFAESCTSGLVSSELGEIPGASKVFAGSIVSYSNQVKTDVLGVSEDIIAEHGAVSEACARSMAENCRTLMKTDLAVSLTGIAGPDGGTPEKPVGLVYVAVSDAKGTIVTSFHSGGNRMRIRRVAALQAFNLLRKRLL